jgi:hypothetical protein
MRRRAAHDATGRDVAGTMLLDQQVLHVSATAASSSSE